MNLMITPGLSINGTYSDLSDPAIPGDKSISHRAALFAGMASGDSHIENFMDSGVTRVLLTALRSLGVVVHLDGTTLFISSPGYQNWKQPDGVIECGNSGTTMRLLAGAIAAAGIPAVLDGSSSLRKRPMNRIITPLQQMGVSIQGTASGTAPLHIAGRAPGEWLTPLSYQQPVASAQVKTALLLAGLAADGQTTILEPGLSRDHTEKMLTAMGVPVLSSQDSSGTATKSVVQIEGIKAKPLPPINLRIPGDFSSAAFLIVASLVCPDSQLVLRSIGLNPTRTGLLDALQRMGANLTISPGDLQSGEPIGDITVATSQLNGIKIAGDQVVRMIDEFPIFAAAASYATGSSVVRDAQELRYKETDRISSLAQELRKIGVAVDEYDDGFAIHGTGTVKGGRVKPHRDHRLAMSLAVAGLAAEQPVIVENAEFINESFPAFTQILDDAGAELKFTG